MQDLGGGLRDSLCGDMRVGVGGRGGGGEEGEDGVGKKVTTEDEGADEGEPGDGWCWVTLARFFFCSYAWVWRTKGSVAKE